MSELIIHMSDRQIQEALTVAATFANHNEAEEGREDGSVRTNDALAALLLAGCREWMKATGHV